MNYPASELFGVDGTRRVVWSKEEYDAALADGWLEQCPVEPSAAMIKEFPVPAKRGPVRPKKEVIERAERNDDN